MKQWSGRVDGPDALRVHETVKIVPAEKLPQGPGIALIGWEQDEGIVRNQGRAGAKDGPDAFRKAFSNLPAPMLPFFDTGNVAAQESLTNASSAAAAKGHLSFVVGGGHDLAKGHFFGLREAFPDKKIAIVNLDAHLDLRPGAHTSGTSFSEIQELEKERFSYTCIGLQKQGNTEQLYKRAKAFGTQMVFAEDFFLHQGQNGRDALQQAIQTHDALYLTLCLDVIAAPFAPGVSACQPFGLLPWHVIPLLRLAASSKKLIGFDIAELSPPFDQDGTTARLAASFAAEVLQTWIPPS